MMNSARCIASILTFFSLSACLGGGGSPSPVSSPRGADELTLPENGTVSFDGEAVVITYSIEANGQATLGEISSEVESTLSLTTSNNKIVGAAFEAPGSSVSLSTPNSLGRLGNVAVVALTNSDDTAGALIIDRPNQNQRFKYLTFGAWSTEPGTAGPGSFSAGVYGEPASTNNVPTSGTATYSGASAGGGWDSGTGYYATTSEISVTTDFRTATITSSNTHAINVDTEEIIGATPALDFSGTGNVTGAGFKADINVDNIIANGKAYGHFFGPNAEEVGGTFTADLDDGFYGGSFGAAQ